MKEIPDCISCGRTRELRPDGDCFACHAKGIRFGFVGGEGYGRKAFHDSTISEAIAEHQGNDPTREYEPRHTKANAWAPVK